IISAINAATLKPTQCALWLRATVPPEKRNFFYRGFNRVYDPIERGYVRLVAGMGRRAGMMVILAIVFAGAGIWGVGRFATAFIPLEDQGYFVVAVQLPDGAALGRTQRALDEVSKAVLAVPGVEHATAISGISALDNNASLPNAGAV